LRVDLEAVRCNYRALLARSAPAECASVVKADAYGLGLAKVATTLLSTGCRTFFVATAEEALRIRYQTDAARIFQLGGPMVSQVGLLIRHRIIPVLNSTEQVAVWRSAAEDAGHVLEAAIQVDTGMTRLGLDPAELRFIAASKSFRSRIAPVLLLSHLASAERRTSTQSADQLERFISCTRLLPGVPGSLANSAGVFLGSDYHFDLTRPGAAIYGINPCAPFANPMRCVATLEGRILQIRHAAAGRRVGYGGDTVLTRKSRLAVVGIGYADGVPRAFAKRGCFRHGEWMLPLVGPVSMDATIVDVTDADVDCGDWLQVFGGAADLEQVADAAGTIAYEILARIGMRVDRVYS
jgi:alanine racemase